MKIFCSLILTKCLITMIFANVTVYENQLKPLVNQCYSQFLGIGYMEIGEQKTMNKLCIRAMCDEDLRIYYHVCPALTLPPNCTLLYVKVDSMNQYPECCPYVECS